MATTTLKTTIQLRRDTATNWSSVGATFIPKAGEPVVTLPSGTQTVAMLKVGDGTSTWNDLKYVGVSADGKTLVVNENTGTLGILGFDQATNTTVLCKNADGDMVWEAFDPSAISDALQNVYTKAQTDEEIKKAVSTLYKFVASIQFVNLPEANADTVGNVYNIKDAFTTTDKFLEGAGEKYDAGNNIVIVSYENGSGENPVTEYAYDVLAAPLDVAGIATEAVNEVVDLFKQNVVSGISNPVFDSESGEFQIPFTKFDGTDDTGAIINTNEHIVIPLVSSTQPGLMSSADKAKLDTVGEGAIAGIKIGSQDIPAVDGIAIIPIGNDQNLGGVKSSDINNMVEINADGTMEVVSLGISKLTQSADEELIISGGSSVI